MIKKNLKKQIQIILNLYNSEKYQSKQKILNKKLISDSNPKFAYLYNLLGLILTGQQKDLDEAIRIWYKKGLEIKARLCVRFTTIWEVLYANHKGLILQKQKTIYKRSIELDQ